MRNKRAWRNIRIHCEIVFCTLKMEAVDFLEVFLFLNEFLHYPQDGFNIQHKNNINGLKNFSILRKINS
jgi:hypothetical protein